MTTNCMDIQIQIGKEVPWTGRPPQVDIIFWDPSSSHALVRKNHSVSLSTNEA